MRLFAAAYYDLLQSPSFFIFNQQWFSGRVEKCIFKVKEKACLGFVIKK